ncbi:keywimysin-related RiPP [Kutzneria viridogrisea]|uniref:keywimysin-related RiPP n=1 Tax=Kutzneria TaxID=43356 RepID=UPI0011DC79DA
MITCALVGPFLDGLVADCQVFGRRFQIGSGGQWEHSIGGFSVKSVYEAPALIAAGSFAKVTAGGPVQGQGGGGHGKWGHGRDHCCRRRVHDC